jgi:hypothetical protein
MRVAACAAARGHLAHGEVPLLVVDKSNQRELIVGTLLPFKT